MKKWIILFICVVIFSCVETPNKKQIEEKPHTEKITLLGYGMVKGSNKTAGGMIAQNYAYSLLGAQIDGIDFEYTKKNEKIVKIQLDSSFQGARVYETKVIKIGSQSFVITIVGIELELSFNPKDFKIQQVEILLNDSKAANPQYILTEALSQLAEKENWKNEVSGKAFLTDLSFEESDSNYLLKAQVYFKIK